MPTIKQLLKSAAAVPTQSRLHLIGERFEGFTKNGDGYKACCPAHDDSKPSLSIREGKNGCVLVHCHAGCETDRVLSEVGLRSADLFPGNPMIAAAYDYRDEDGELLFQVVRMDPKDFRQRAPDGNGGWSWTTKHVRRVLYRLPELSKADPKQPVFIVEGEKDADRLAALGLVATTNAGGAGKWKAEYGEALRGRNAVILRDNDEPGRKHAEQVAASCCGVAASVRSLLLPGLPAKGDASDWLDAGGTVEKLLRLVSQTPEWINASVNGTPVSGNYGSNNSSDSGDRIRPDGNSVVKIVSIVPPALGKEARHGLFGDFLDAVEPYTEATPPAMLAHLLPALGTLIGPGPRVFSGSWQPARVFTMVVGPTNAGRKGTSLAPVEMLMEWACPAFWNSQRVSGLSSGEGLICVVADKEGKDDDGNKIVVESEKRVYVVEEEFSRVLANITREGNILSQVIRNCFDNGNLNTLTVERRSATGAHIAITGHCTAEELHRRLNHVELANGFANRFLWFAVKSDKIMSRTTPIPDRVFAPLVSRVKELYHATGVTKGRKTIVELDHEAAELWDDVYPTLRKDRAGLAGQMVARGAPIVLRTALIYAMVDGRAMMNGTAKIKTEHLRAALAVWDYCDASVQLLFGHLSGDALGDRVLSLLAGGPMTRDDLNKHLSNQQKTQLSATLTRLESQEKILSTRSEGRGRPATVWSLRDAT